MTVTYSPRELLVFSHLKGTVLPEVWRMCAFTCALAYALCHIYNPIRRTVRDGGPKTILYYIFHDCDAFFGLCTSFVTFILSFFNATIFGRWWKMRELCGTVNGRTVDTCVLLSAYIKDQEQLDEMLRLLWLAHALHVHSVIPSSHAGSPRASAMPCSPCRHRFTPACCRACRPMSQPCAPRLRMSSCTSPRRCPSPTPTCSR